MDGGLPPFSLESYFAKYEFSAQHLLCSSDAESISMQELILNSDPECMELWSSLRLGYTETRGNPILRNEIIKQYDHCKSEDVLCLAGAEEVLKFLLELLSLEKCLICVYSYSISL